MPVKAAIFASTRCNVVSTCGRAKAHVAASASISRSKSMVSSSVKPSACSPFLSFNLEWGAGDDAPALQLGGRRGVKEFLAAEMADGK
jgi:hypothetical protein